MKKLLLMLLIIPGIIIAQSNRKDFYDFYLGMSIDPAMVIYGPYNKSNDIGTTFNAEFKGGFELKTFRFGNSYEIHPAINYTKWSYIVLDYKYEDFIFNNFNIYLGGEISKIRRKHDNSWWGDPYNYKKINTSNSIGVNLEIQYKIYNYLYISYNLNLFTAEEELVRYDKNLRWDGMIGLYIKF